VSAITLVRELLHKEGFAALFKGLAPALIIQGPGNGFYFWTYERIKKIFGVNEELSSDRAIWCKQVLYLCIAGGSAACISWLPVYPFDVIKTQMFCERKKKITMLKVARDGYRRSGILFFFNGLGLKMISTFINNAISLPAFELSNRYLLQKRD